MLGKFLSVTAFCLFLIPTTADAQLSDFPMSPIQYPSAMSSIPLANIASTNKTVRTSVNNRQNLNETVPPTVSLSYRVSAARRKANLTNFAVRMQEKDPQGAAKLQQIISSSDPVGQIDQMMRTVGLNANNLADCYAVYWVAAWEAKYNRDMGASRSMYQSVSLQAAQAMANAQQLQSASDATKQEAAEALLLQAALIAGAKEVYQNDRQQLTLLAQAVDQGARAVGLDLDAMTLTPNGFVPRSGGRSDAGDVSGNGSQLAATEEGGSNLALYAVAGTGLLAGVFALGKGLAKKG